MKKSKKALLITCAMALALQMVGTGPAAVKAEVSIDKVIKEAASEKISGKIFVSDQLVYHVIAKNKAEVCGSKYKKTQNVIEIPETVSYNGKKYEVTKIIDLTAVDHGGYGEFYGEELSAPSYYDDVYSSYEYSNAYVSCLPEGTRKLSAVKLVLPKTITYIGEGAFAGNNTLKEIEFASKYKKLVIGKAAFAQCSNLKTINFPKGTTEIGDYAADASCITIPASVKKIGAGVVDQNTRKVGIDKKNKKFKMKNGLLYTYDETKLLGVSAKAKKNLKLSSKTTEIAEAAFASSKVRKVDLGGNVKEIPAKAFANCNYLQEVTGTENVEKISYGAFFRCGSLKKLEDVSKVKEIETASFWQAPNVTLPVSSNMEIADYAFSGYYYGTIMKVTVPENDPVYSVEKGLLIKTEAGGKKVILQTEDMEKIAVPEGVTEVAAALGNAAAGAGGICKEVILPESLKTQIGAIHISGGKVQFLSANPPLFGKEFWIQCWSGAGTVIVPIGCKEAYRTAIDTSNKDYGYPYFKSMFEINLTLLEA